MYRKSTLTIHKTKFGSVYAAFHLQVALLTRFKVLIFYLTGGMMRKLLFLIAMTHINLNILVKNVNTSIYR